MDCRNGRDIVGESGSRDGDSVGENSSGENDGDGDNPNTQQTPEYTKDKYNVKIMKRKSLLRSHQQPT
jgi:hypothetical protein